MIVSQFCGDFNIKKCDVDVRFKSAEEMPWVNDPKGIRRAQGYCSSRGVALNSKHWALINKWEQRELVYHELGHCLLDLGHNDDVSIMNPFPKAGHYHVKSDGSNWKSLVRELQNRVK